MRNFSNTFLIILILILITFYICEIKKDFFYNYPFDPQIQTPQTNYNTIIKNIQDHNKYKYNLSVALSPIPTIQCDRLKTKTDCNNYGCNWFGTYCSAMYPSYL